MGYGRRAVQLLQAYYEGKCHSLSEENSHVADTPSSAVMQVDCVGVFTFFYGDNEKNFNVVLNLWDDCNW